MHRCQAKNPEQFRNERDAIPEVRNTDGQLLAPNGRPSKIQNLELWRTIRHPNFKKWFGDWELAATGIDTIVGKDGKVNYDTAKKIASGIVSGSVQTANEQRQQAQVRGGSRNVEASVILTGKERTKPTASRGSERFEGIARQEEALERYAKQEKIWLDEKTDSRKFVNSGKESRVYDNGDTVRKFTDPRSINRGVTPLDHLNNITSFDAVFPETAYTVEGFARDASGKLKFVTTQPFIVGRLSTPAEIERAMKDRGFTKIDSETFENADYVVHDLAPRNVIFDPESSQAFVIDANVTQKKAENETYSVNDVSKVVDENGEPLVVYHGTPDSRGIYKHGFRTRKEAIFNDQQDEPQKSFFFSDDVRVADTYADPLRSSDYQNAEPETLPLFINIREATMLNLRGARWRQVDDAIVSAKKAGHDGLVIRNVVDPYNLPEATPRTRRSMTTYVAFAPNQIKSIFNRGTFDADEDSILKMVAWHGSPHRFDKFSTEKIGTGEVTVKTTATGKAVGETANILTSAYGKPNAGLQRWIDDGLLRYRNTDKGKTWWHGQNRLQLPTRDSRDTTSKNKVLTQDDFVNTPLFKRRTAEDSAEQKELTFYSTNDLVDRLDPSQIQLDENGELRMDAKAAEVWRRLDIHYTEEVLGKAGNDNIFMGLALSAKQITDRTNFYREQIEPQFIEAGHTDESLTGIRALMTGLDDLAKVSKKQAVNKSANWGLALV